MSIVLVMGNWRWTLEEFNFKINVVKLKVNEPINPLDVICQKKKVLKWQWKMFILILSLEIFLSHIPM